MTIHSSQLNMTIHSSSGFTVMEMDGQCGHLYSGLNVVRRKGYMIASNGDVFHSFDCAAGATIEGSTFEANLDDFFNIHSTVHVGWSPKTIDVPFQKKGPQAPSPFSTREGAHMQTQTSDRSPLGPQELYIIQPRLTATAESVNRSVVDDW
jgi:hypothetical protein